jgi:2-amino-4-hydroxy-6-hydroxymethyldihydropteridine diphosphokinase / dihydropteroate synthase
MSHRAFIGLGANLGDRTQNLREAIRRLGEVAEVKLASSVYETEPWGFEGQPKFLNQVVEVETELGPEELLQGLKGIEVAMGREESFRYGPRKIDLDILFYDDVRHTSDSLTIPHPALPERAFVLIPLQEIAPGFMHPELHRSISDLAEGIDKAGITKLSDITENKMFEWGKRTYIMGILNLTPDSFSGDGLVVDEDYITNAITQAEQFVRDGADILDLGAESSRPGSEPVSVETELARLMPVLEGILDKQLPAVISIDTWKSAVAEKCLATGADWINDIWRLTADPDLASVIAGHNAGVILMDNSSSSAAVKDLGDLGKSYEGTENSDFMQTIKTSLGHSIEIARAAGIPKANIILDPGIGFGKSQEQNLALINHLDELKGLGLPLLVGPSRKSFIGRVLDLPVESREEGTAAAVAISIARGADIVRVHDVRMMARVAQMTDAIVRAGR